MKKIVFLFIYIFAFSNYLYADLVNLEGFSDRDGVYVNLCKLTQDSIIDSKEILLKTFKIYYEKHEKQLCPEGFKQSMNNLLIKSSEEKNIIIAAYKNNVCVGWILIEFDYQKNIVYLKTKVWLSFDYAPYLIFSVFKVLNNASLKMFLLCDKANLGAQKFYKMLGFNCSNSLIDNKNTEKYFGMEYLLDNDLQNINFEIETIHNDLLEIESYINVLENFLYSSDNAQFIDYFNKKIREAKKTLTKMMIYYRSRLFISSGLIDIHSRDYLLSVINQINFYHQKFDILMQSLKV